ncbi:hypothetical protein LPJ71_010782, partial [Coemansia sp. S17]
MASSSTLQASKDSGSSSAANAYADEPWSDRTLSNYIVRAEHPFNAEVRLDKLVEDF